MRIKIKTILPPLTFLFFAGFATPHLTSCSGNECAATSTIIDDQDSDCVDDSADNCVGWYNPDQFDGDEDGFGVACDSDDTDATTVGLALSEDADLIGRYSWDDSNCFSKDFEMAATATSQFRSNFEGSWQNGFWNQKTERLEFGNGCEFEITGTKRLQLSCNSGCTGTATRTAL